MSKPPVFLSLRTTPELIMGIERLRTSPSESRAHTVRGAVEHLALLQAAELRRLRHYFSLQELQALYWLRMELLHTPEARLRMSLVVEDALLTKNLKLEGEAGRRLVETVRSLTPGQSSAIVSALERMGNYEPDLDEHGFSLVGLLAA